MPSPQPPAPVRTDSVLAFDIGGARIKAATDAGPLGEVPTPLHDFAAFVAALRGFLTGSERSIVLSVAGIVPAEGAAKVANIPCLDGGGVITDGRLLRGVGGHTGELGHGPIIRDPAFACGCGQTGCLDTVGSARGLERLHHHLTGQSLTSHAILERWQGPMPALDRATRARILRLAVQPLLVVAQASTDAGLIGALAAGKAEYAA